MKKIVFIIILILSIAQFNVFSQNTEEIKIGLNKSYKMEGETLLKEFIIDLKPNQEKEFSLMLDKKTLYAWHTYLAKKNTLEIRLFDNKNNLLFKNEKNDKAIIRFTARNDQEQLYRLYFKNTSEETVTTVAYLTYIDKINAKQFDTNTNIKLKSLLNASKGTYLKDFKANLKPDATARYSIVLSKNSIYELLYYNQDNNQFAVNLYSNEDLISPIIENIEPDIVNRHYKISKTGVYHLFVKNKSSNTAETYVLLNFLDKTVEEIQNNTLNEKETEKETETIYFQVDKMPKFKTKECKDFNDFINNELNYPEDAKNNMIEGKVNIQFTVGKNGYIKDAKVVHGAHPSLDQEALRIVYSSPKWEPGIKDKEPVDVILTFPIIFKL